MSKRQKVLAVFLAAFLVLMLPATAFAGNSPESSAAPENNTASQQASEPEAPLAFSNNNASEDLLPAVENALALTAAENTSLRALSINWPVSVDETNFPDATFRQYVVDEWAGGDSSLTQAEAEAVTNIDVSRHTIANLQGVGYFTKLQTHKCSSNDLANLDVSTNTELQNLSCSGNDLTSLDVSKNTKLQTLICNSNDDLAILTLGTASELKSLHCSRCKITELDLSGATKLEELACGGNSLTALDVSEAVALQTLGCSNNPITSLTLSNGGQLKTLDCLWTYLSSLDVSKNTELESLRCDGSRIINLDISNNTKLKTLDCMSSKELTSIKLSGAAALETLNLSDCEKLTSLDVSNNTKLKDLNCTFDAELSSINVDGAVALETLDLSECKKLTSLDVSNNTKLKTLNCSFNTELSSIKLSGAVALETLDCYSCKLQDLDVSKAIALQTLDCSENELGTIDVSANTALESLYCDSNKLQAIDVSKNTALENFSCYDNQLTRIDVSKNTVLRELDCGSNQLSELDLSKNTALESLDCSDNHLLDVVGLPSATYMSDGSKQTITVPVRLNTGATKSYVSIEPYSFDAAHSIALSGAAASFDAADHKFTTTQLDTPINFSTSLGQAYSLTGTVTFTASGSKDITSFVVAGKTATIQGTSISVSLPYGTNLSALDPDITHTGMSISPTGAQDFSVPVAYTVTAADGTTKVYTATVSLSNSVDVISAPSEWSGEGPAIFRLDAPFKKFLRLLLDGAKVSPDNYTVTSGSTVITLSESYLKTLAAGNHIFTAIFSDGEATIPLTIKQASTDPPPTSGGGSVPQTGEPFPLIPVSVALILGVLGLGAIAAGARTARANRLAYLKNCKHACNDRRWLFRM